MQRTPLRDLHRNLLFTTSGATWAVWRLRGLEYGHTTVRKRAEALDITQALLRSIGPEALIAGLCTGSDARDVVARMAAGVDLDRLPYWVEICDNTLDALDGLVLMERSFWLAVPLPSAFGGITFAAASLLGGGSPFGAMTTPVTASERRLRSHQAEQITRRIPAQLKPAAATPPEVCWMFQRAARRGLLTDGLGDDLTGIEPASTTSRSGLSHAWLDEVLFDEGGRTDLATGQRSLRSIAKQLNPFTRRFLKLVTDAGESYQAFLGLAEVPPSGMMFPGGSEWLMHLDDFDFPVDWAIRMRIVDREAAQAKNRRQTRELTQQVGQYARTDEDGRTNVDDVPEELAMRQSELEEYRSRLAATTTEVEVQATAVACLWGRSAHEVQERADVFRSVTAMNEYHWARPVGGQEQLYWDMLPGVKTSRTARDYTQVTLSRDYAASMPFAAQELGDPSGGLLAVRRIAGGIRPVLFDPPRGPAMNASGSVGVCGELGSGKSVALKTLKTIVIGRGGRAITIDRTKSEEWVRFAHSCPWFSQIVRVSSDADYSLDPLRVFPLATGATMTRSFLTVLFGIGAKDDVSLLLARHLKPQRLSEWDEPPSMGALRRRLAAAAVHDPVAAKTIALIDAYADTDLGRVAFDDTVPPLQLADAEDVIFATNAISLPTQQEVENAHLFDRLPLEKSLGRALLYLIAAISKDYALSNDTFVAVFLDEAGHLTRASAEGEQLVLDLILDGRKHNAAAYLASQDPDHLGGDTIRGLLPIRIVARQTSNLLARKSARFLFGISTNGQPTDADNTADVSEADLDEAVELITRGLSPLDVPADEQAQRAGEVLMRDLTGRPATAQILIPFHDDIAEGILTTPGSRRQPQPVAST